MATNRRTFLKTGMALLAGSAVGITPTLGRSAGSLKANADALLKGAADAGDVPGVVATATTRNSTIYEGGFGKRVLGRVDNQLAQATSRG